MTALSLDARNTESAARVSHKFDGKVYDVLLAEETLDGSTEIPR